MTTEQYIGRETALSDTLLSSKGGTKYYVLHPRNDPDVIISSCEVTSKRALVSNPSGTREVSAYSLASVFTNPRFRGRGMASFLLRKIQEVVDQTNNECGALYSDIGRSFFTSLGWKDFRSPQAVISMMSRHFHPQKPADVEYLTDMDLIPLCKFDVDAMRRRFRDLGARDGKTHVAFLPTPAQLVWHFTRDRYECEALLGRAVMNRGARTAESESWIVWSHDVREKTLKVLRIVNSQEGERWGEWRRWHMRGLLLAALEEAKEWGLSKVVIWEPSAEVVETVKALWYELGTDVKVAYEVREDRAIPSLRWKGDKDLEDVVWEENQCYAWC
jgi:GNAT superfamily N-acetyltransferase